MTKKFILALGLILVVSASALFLPQMSTWAEKINSGLSFFIFLTQVASVLFFLTSLKAFKQKLRHAYTMLAFGILLFSLSLLQLPLVYFVTYDPIVMSWFIAGTSLLGALIMYASMRRFASLLEIRSFLTSGWLLLAVPAVTAGITALVPHVSYELPESTIDGIFGLYVASGAINALTALIVLQIRGKLGKVYRISMGWLAVALFFASFDRLTETIIKLSSFFNQPAFDNYFNYGIMLWPFLLASLCFLKSSLAFNATSKDAADLPDNASTIDVINYAAQLVSQPVAIDTILDKVRQITAAHDSNAKLSEEDETSLRNVYLQIEKYLITKEQLRTYTKEDLRSRLPEQFRHSLAK